MLISFNWLKQHVSLPDSTTPEEVADKLKMSTVEVESVRHLGKELDQMVVGKVVSADKHPNADKLQICRVNIGVETVQIVCGGSNVAEGMLVAVALPGAQVRWHGQGEPIVLEQTAIRGQDSFGMICASDEIGLGEQFPKKEEKEILDLTALGLRPGTALAAALHQTDSILEIDNKSLSNRPDLLGHYGLAREVAVLFNREVLPYAEKTIVPGKELGLKVTVADPALCHRYMAVAVAGVTVAESPAWLRECLSAVGIRPINNLVDITNYVMLDIGQPTHAFDARRLQAAKKITLAAVLAAEAQTFTTLDGKERSLTADTLLITNGVAPLALAGIMGGTDSGIAPDTTTVVFESATFDAVAIRRTSTRLSLRTDSATRFEKSQDPLNAERALNKLVELTLQLCPGSKVASAVADVKHFRLAKQPIEVPIAFFVEKIGQELPLKTITTILERLGFTVKEKKKVLLIGVPSWRATRDVRIPEDIVEEVLRIYGYENIAPCLPRLLLAPPSPNALRNLERRVAEVLSLELGFTEVYNYSFVSEAQIKRLGGDPAEYLQLDNPISKEKPFLRRNLLPNLIENITTNLHRADSLKLFEIGKVFHADESGPRTREQSDELLPRQDTWLTLMYVRKKDASPFWEARRAAETICRRLGLAVSFYPGARTRSTRGNIPPVPPGYRLGSLCLVGYMSFIRNSPLAMVSKNEWGFSR